MKNKRNKNIFDIFINIILILLSLLVIYWLLELIFGGSPGLNEFNFSMIILIVGFLFKIYREMGEIKLESRFMSKGVKEGFNNIKKDMNSIKKKIGV